MKCSCLPGYKVFDEIRFHDGRTIAYEYDAEERITKVTDSAGGVTEYTYDALGQLLTETVDGTTVSAMTYDKYGNILTKNSIAYTYGNAKWKDLLTAYNGQAISYDAQGNPTHYLGHTLTWEKGRQLKTFGANSYKYNNDGIRIQKRTATEIHDYILDGTNIIKELVTDTSGCPKYTNEYLYDLDGTVCGIKHNGTAYYFYKNLQGDVIAITNANGAVVARYTYDAWGVPTIKEDTSGCNIAAINPFRYRGYYYDAETNLYYLQSRYYDPAVGRFINADRTENVCLTRAILSTNAYCYCENNPVNEIDDQGNIIRAVIKLLGKMLWGALVNVLLQLVSETVLTVLAGKTKFGSFGDYVAVACQGALDAVWNKGIVGKIMKAVISNVFGQIVDWILGKSKRFNVWSLIVSIIDCILIDFLEKKLRVTEPKYIRDIKKEAHGLGIKGKRNLEAYLQAKIKLLKKYNFRVTNLMNVAYSVVKEIVLTFVEIVKEWIVAIAKRIKATIPSGRMNHQYA